jgi:hypothetical protein
MKNNHRRLKAVLKMFPAETFFSASFNNYDCTLIAYYSPQVVRLVLDNKFKVSESTSTEFLKFRRGNVLIAIAEK